MLDKKCNAFLACRAKTASPHNNNNNNHNTTKKMSTVVWKDHVTRFIQRYDTVLPEQAKVVSITVRDDAPAPLRVFSFNRPDEPKYDLTLWGPVRDVKPGETVEWFLVPRTVHVTLKDGTEETRTLDAQCPRLTEYTGPLQIQGWWLMALDDAVPPNLSDSGQFIQFQHRNAI